MKKFFLIIFILLTQIVSFADAQEITMEKAITYLNEKLKGNCIFSIKEKLTIKFIENGKEVREEVFYPEQIDPNSVNFATEGQYVYFKCMENAEGCIQKWNYSTNAKKATSRSTIPVGQCNEKTIIGIQKAIVHIIMLIQDPKYKLFEFFE